MATAAVRRDAAPGRLEPPGARGRARPRDRSTSRSYWRSTTFSSTVEPTIYLLAFGFGFGSLVATVGGYDYVEFVGTGTVATAVLFSSVLPGDVRDVREVQVPAHLRRDPRRAGRHRGARHRRGAVDRDARRRLRLRADARRDGLRPRRRAGACCSSRSSASSRASAGRAFGHRRSPASLKSIENFNYVTSAVHHAAVPRRRHVLPDRPACPSGRRSLAELNPLLPLRPARAPRRLRLRRLGRRLEPRRSSSSSALAMWRLAIVAMTRKLID